ncbi:MAG: VOC family protein, partial [Daejeonella sp.]
MAHIQKITPNLWFDKEAEEAVKFYTSIFKNSSVGRISRYGKAGFENHKMPEGTVMTMEFKLEGQSFLALNGGPHFTFTEAVSFVINCENQDEIDYFWDKLSAGGDPKAQMCGWVKDKFGLSWQVVPGILPDLFTNSGRNSGKVMEALMSMKKLNIAELEKAG